jgi:hypothetical protein
MPVLPAASVSSAIMLLVPLTSVTVVLQLPSLWRAAVPSGAVLPLSKSDTVAPGVAPV